MIDKRKHIDVLSSAISYLRTTSVQSDHFSLILSLYGLKVLADSSDVYLEAGLEIDAKALWDDLKRSMQPNKELRDILRTLSTCKPLEPLETGMEGVVASYRDDQISQVIFEIDRLDSHAETLGEVSTEIGEVVDVLFSDRAGSEGLRGGEYFTPQVVNRLKADLLLADGRTRETFATAYDPACGIGGALIEVHRATPYERRRAIFYHGQDRNANTLFLCTWNLVLHGILRFALSAGDTLYKPGFLEEGRRVQRFDIVVSDPPFNVPVRDDFGGRDPYQRFRYGDIRGKRGDFALLQHVLASLKENGRAAVTVIANALSRSGFEQKIRENMVRDDVISASIALPGAIFPGTNVAASVLVFELDKPTPRRGKVWFIDVFRSTKASRVIDPELYTRILEVFHHNTSDTDAEQAGLSRLEEHGFSLLPQVYIPKEARRFPPIGELDTRIAQLEDELAETRYQLDRVLRNLNA